MVDRFRRRTAFKFAFLACFICVGIWSIWPLDPIEKTQEPDWSDLVSTAPKEPERSRDIASFEPIWQEILPDPVATKPPVQAPRSREPVEKRLDITLLATFVEQGQSRALINVSGEVQRVLVGDRVGRSLVTSIRDRSIELETNGRRTEIGLPERIGQELLGGRP